ITPAGVVTTIGGLAYYVGSADGTGSAARFYSPQGLAVNAVGTLYVADTNNNTIRVGVDGALFMVEATGSPIPSYQWQVSTNGGGTWVDLTEAGPYSGTRTAVLAITRPSAGLSGFQYRSL